jgi:hypothetical protein
MVIFVEDDRRAGRPGEIERERGVVGAVERPIFESRCGGEQHKTSRAHPGQQREVSSRSAE